MFSSSSGTFLHQRLRLELRTMQETQRKISSAPGGVNRGRLEPAPGSDSMEGNPSNPGRCTRAPGARVGRSLLGNRRR